MALPVVVISFNNHEFVANTLAQLRRRGVDDIVVIDNASNWDETRAWLDTADCRVIRNADNQGHLCWAQPGVYEQLPDLFCVTDPDLQFHPELPADFIAVMAELATRHQALKVGFALDISDQALMFQDPDYHRGHSIAGWESQFWQQRLPDEALEVYLAGVDTTFHVFNKRGQPQRQLRVAGRYTARHLPWYRHNALVPPERMALIYRHATRVSTIARLHQRHHTAASGAMSAANAVSEPIGDQPTRAPMPPADPQAQPQPAPPMKQTPAHNIVNADLLRLIPPEARRIVEVGCMQGAMARAHRSLQPAVHYTGIDIDPDYAQAAAQHCQRALAADIEAMPPEAFQSLFPSDCWIFGDCLEHLRDPWRVLRQVRAGIDAQGCVLVCIPNAQHWSLQMRLATGQFRYEDSGLLDRTHLRWFTRVTLLELFAQTGWQVAHGFSRQLPQAAPPALMAGVRAIAQAAGADPAQAETDANAFQYVFKLAPV